MDYLQNNIEPGVIGDSVDFENDELLNIINKIENRNVTIGVLGLGYVGLPLLLRFTYAGFKSIGFDTDASKVEKLSSGRSYIEHVDASSIKKARDMGLEATTDFSRASDIDVIIVCVPTPLTIHYSPDLSYVFNSIDAIVPYMRPGQILSLESTTYPGTTEEQIKPRIEAHGLIIGVNVFVVFSPEREDPGNVNFKTRAIPKVCGGITDNCRRAGIALYSSAFDEVVPVSSARAAEMTKLLENTFRLVNIAMVNEMKIIADVMNIDIYEVIRAAATKPFGFAAYYPGPGIGGHCIPIDPFYLTWKAREYGMHTRLIELAGAINEDMPQWVIKKLADALNASQKAISGSKILIVGISYKKDIDDLRESPSVKIMELLHAKGAEIFYSDPHVPAFRSSHHSHLQLKSVHITPERLSGYDAILIATDHSAFDYVMLQKYASLIVDTRGVYPASFGNVIRA